LKFHDFPGLEIENINSMTFQVFHDPYKPCILVQNLDINKQNSNVWNVHIRYN